MSFSRVERAALVDALEVAGPAAPTLCEGWQTAHLAAHVVLRERSPLAAGGLLGGPLGRLTESRLAAAAEEAKDPAGWSALLEKVAEGPLRIHPLALAGDKANLVELAVHGEDVRRAVPVGTLRSTPVERTPEHLDALFDQLLVLARLRYRRSAVGVVLVVPGGRRARVRTASAGAGTVVLRGDVLDLLLHAFGRGEAADVTAQGASHDVQALADVLPGARAAA